MTASNCMKSSKLTARCVVPREAVKDLGKASERPWGSPLVPKNRGGLWTCNKKKTLRVSPQIFVVNVYYIVESTRVHNRDLEWDCEKKCEIGATPPKGPGFVVGSCTP